MRRLPVKTRTLLRSPNARGKANHVPTCMHACVRACACTYKDGVQVHPLRKPLPRVPVRVPRNVSVSHGHSRQRRPPCRARVARRLAPSCPSHPPRCTPPPAAGALHAAHNVRIICDSSISPPGTTGSTTANGAVDPGACTTPGQPGAGGHRHHHHLPSPSPSVSATSTSFFLSCFLKEDFEVSLLEIRICPLMRGGWAISEFVSLTSTYKYK